MNFELSPLKWKPFTARALKPQGWLRRQLEIQAEGLSGNLDRFWPDIKESKWIGGEQEGWERVPYWLDGFIPLAYLLEDQDMISRAKRYVDAIVNGQKADGWLCPCADHERSKYDMWALFLILKVLTLYADCEGTLESEQRIREVVEKALRNFERHIDSFILFDWAAARWFEALIPIYWLYERTEEQWLLELACKIKAQGLDYETLYAYWSYEKPMPRGNWSQMNHVVNQAMAVKALPLFGRLSGKEQDFRFADRMLEQLYTYHGTVTGIFTGDECLAGTSPVQGTELCAVVEFMYSIEHLIQLTGECRYGDLLEWVAFNALPATMSPDMWTHQYDQLVNQIACKRIPEEDVHFTTNSGESHLFGLEPNYGCCTANFNQGFPKLALSAFMRTETGIVCTALLPSKLTTEVAGIEVTVSLITDYPFHHQLTFVVEASAPVSFDLEIRIPGYTSKATVDGINAPGGKFYKCSRKWNGRSEVRVSLPMDWEQLERPGEMVALKRGPLLYSIAIDEEWQRVDYGPDEKIRVYPHCDYQVIPKSKWNYAYVDPNAEFTYCGISDVPFHPQNPPCKGRAKVVEIEWRERHGVAAPKPESRSPVGEVCEVDLIPYGCTTLRMTEVPIIHRKD